VSILELKKVRDSYLDKIRIARKVMKKARDAYQIKLADDDIASFQKKVDELNAEIKEIRDAE